MNDLLFLQEYSKSTQNVIDDLRYCHRSKEFDDLYELYTLDINNFYELFKLIDSESSSDFISFCKLASTIIHSCYNDDWILSFIICKYKYYAKLNREHSSTSYFVIDKNFLDITFDGMSRTIEDLNSIEISTIQSVYSVQFNSKFISDLITLIKNNPISYGSPDYTQSVKKFENAMISYVKTAKHFAIYDCKNHMLKITQTSEPAYSYE